MKMKKIYNITLLTSTLLFIGCSKSPQKTPDISASVDASIYNILGVTEPTKHPTSQPRHASFVSPDVTYISYKRPAYFPKKQEQTMATIQKIETQAKSFLGVPYVWGATGPNKFDCSGFTQWVYRDVGIHIPRVSKDQARVGEFVKYTNLKRGDMVFFDTKKKRTGRVNHVGIYLGNGNFIHASSKGKGVVIYNFEEDKFYKDRFLWARRVVNPTIHYSRR